MQTKSTDLTRTAWLPSRRGETPTRHFYVKSQPVKLPNGTSGVELIYECTVTGRQRRWGFEAA